jgi:phage terminase large subunit-like protein
MMFSEAHATRAVKFFEQALVHCDGEWAGKPFLLMPWQRDLVSRLFGTLRDDGTRQYRTCYVEIPRKNGKSETAAGLALYLLFADKEMGAQIYGAAGDRDQASIVFRVAAEMVRRSPILSKEAKVIDSTKRIVVMKTASFYRAIPADASGSHGFNASGVVVDEVHVQPNRDLIDVLNTSTGARRQPLTFYITTAGYDKHSICWELHDYATKVRDGVIQDETFLPVLYNVAETDDWRSPDVWAKANPSLGTTLKPDYLAGECKRASEVPAYENTFRRLHLNQWTAQDTRWLPLTAWDECEGDMPDLEGRMCYGGIDLSSTTDLSAFALLFPLDEGGYAVKVWTWVPEDNIERRERRDRVPYGLWAKQGHIEMTPGNVIDYDFIRAKINDLRVQYDVREIAYDPWNATQLVTQLSGDGVEMFPLRQGFASLTGPTKELEKAVLGRLIKHDGNPVLRWAVDNVTVETDPAGNLKPSKSKSRERIDPVVAVINAIDRATRHEDGGSVYEEMGLSSVG